MHDNFYPPNFANQMSLHWGPIIYEYIRVSLVFELLTIFSSTKMLKFSFKRNLRWWVFHKIKKLKKKKKKLKVVHCSTGSQIVAQMTFYVVFKGDI